MLRRHTGRTQLSSVSFNQVEKNLFGQHAVSRSASRQEKQRIFLADRIRLLNFVEQLASVLELRLELGSHFRADRVTAIVNPGPDRCPEIAG